ncbi:MAG: class I SAM-dependent methyltransferase [Myxococcales bacterium]
MIRQLRKILPPAVRSRLRRAVARVRGLSNFYERVYDRQAAMLDPAESIGGGDFETIGGIELALLRLEGVKPGDTVVDLGCGTGRLAVKLIGHLGAGKYIGIDISRGMLREAARRAPAGGCTVEWKHQRTARFDLPEGSVDVICAFSVFTHMEAEDTYRYFVDARRVVRPGGKLILSCLPFSLAHSRTIFVQQAGLDLTDRWAGVRNVVTTEETIDTLASWAGWRTLRWYRGDRPYAPDVPTLQQSVCVLERPG